MPSVYSLLKQSFATLIVSLLLGLTLLSFLKQSNILSLNGIVQTTVNEFHVATYALTSFIAYFVQKIIPWIDLPLSNIKSDLLLLVLLGIFLNSKIQLPRSNLVHRLANYAGIIMVSGVLLIMFGEPGSSFLLIFFLFCAVTVFPLFAYTIFTTDRDEVHVPFDFYVIQYGTALIIILLYFAGYIELVSK